MLRRSEAPLRTAGGFTLLEALVALALTVLVVSTVLALFGFQRRLARVESDRTQMQQAVRAAHLELASMIRMTGRGGLGQNGPARARPDLGVSLEVASNVEGDARVIAPGAADSPAAVAGTDVLTVRGILTGPVLRGRGNTEDATFLVLRDAGGLPAETPTDARSGRLHVCSVTSAGLAQPLDGLRAAIAAGSEEAILLGGTAGDDAYGVVKLEPGASSPTSTRCDPADPDAGVTLEFTVQGDGGRADLYHELGPAAAGLPPTVTSVGWLGILEEYRYYLREARELPGDDASRLLPRLSRARLYPNTGTAWAGAADNLALDVADQILDFQVSLAFDSSQGGGALADGTLDPDADPIHESPGGENDDWLFNSPDDDPLSAVWARPGTAVISRPWLRAHL
ncbi:MAG TPA: hypothetical protein VLF66_20610, partial [Thermoanaerobaculia bacterium]|nr:hypothetical protein [Thermoanaerobaculia bacterium]